MLIFKAGNPDQVRGEDWRGKLPDASVTFLASTLSLPLAVQSLAHIQREPRNGRVFAIVSY